LINLGNSFWVMAFNLGDAATHPYQFDKATQARAIGAIAQINDAYARGKVKPTLRVVSIPNDMEQAHDINQTR
jgi:hypothetical protein